MSRLPTVGGDTDNWGTVLNDYLTTSSNGGAALSASTSVGATTIVLAVVPTDLEIGSMLAIDAGTGECELRVATGISGSTVTVNAALERAHSSSAVVLVATVIHPNMFGCKGDNSTDDWSGLQRLLYQANKLTSRMIYGPIINGGGLTYLMTQPLTFTQHTLHNININAVPGFAPVDANNALAMGMSQPHYAFTATASDNTFACLSPNVFPNVDEPVLFNNMYGETMPGSVVSGRVYYIKTKAGDQRSCTVSTTAGGAELDITSDGAGWATRQIGELTKFWWKDVTLNSSVADLSALVFGFQQPGDIYRLRVNMTAACSRTTYAALIQNAQIARLYNPEFVVDGATNVVALGIGVPYMRPAADTLVTGVHVQDANFDGDASSGQTHIVIGGALVCDAVVLSGNTWLEQPGPEAIRLEANSRGIDLGNLFISGSQANGSVYEHVASSWRVGQIFNSGANHIVVKTADGVLFKTFGSSDNVVSDESNVMHGFRKVASSVMPSVALEGRLYASSTSSVTAAWIWDTIDMDATGGTRVLTLPSAVGVATFRFTVRKKDSSGNAVTVGTTSSQTINGSTTYSLATQYKYVTVESDGANWMVVANN